MQNYNRKASGQRSYGPRRFGARTGSRPTSGASRFSGQRRSPQNKYKQQSDFDVRAFIARSSRQAATAPVQTEYVIKHRFDDFELAPEIKENIRKRGFTNPTPIQDQAIPIVLSGQDVVGIANTGTGKSAAFLLPLMDKFLKSKFARALVIVPTRELAVQLQQELQAFSQGLRLHSVLCVGGININPQVYNLRRPHNFVIGTPGRLKDLVNRQAINLSEYSSIVLDEVDRMLDMGFIHDMQFLISRLPQKRQSLFFSATLDKQVETVMQQFVRDFVRIYVKVGETAQSVTQEVLEVNATAKIDKLAEILQSSQVEKAIVFVRTKWGADKLAKTLHQHGLHVGAIHGDKRQNQRMRIMTDFKAGRMKALIATDVAARGLDIANLSHVINYDLPNTSDDYVHRIGRVGRAHNQGVAISFVTT